MIHWFQRFSNNSMPVSCQNFCDLLIFIIKGFRTIVYIFIVISTTFRSICPPAFFRCLSNSGIFTELRTRSFIESTFILWPHQEDVQILLDHVNSIRPSIQFTMEKEQDNKLPFLDVLVTCTEQGFRSSVYRKPTFTG